MTTLITIVHVFASIFLILVVLLQSGKGGGMGAAFGGGGGGGQVFGGRGAGIDDEDSHFGFNRNRPDFAFEDPLPATLNPAR